jgi:hypothetical protein
LLLFSEPLIVVMALAARFSVAFLSTPIDLLSNLPCTWPLYSTLLCRMHLTQLWHWPQIRWIECVLLHILALAVAVAVACSHRSRLRVHDTQHLVQRRSILQASSLQSLFAYHLDRFHMMPLGRSAKGTTQAKWIVSTMMHKYCALVE